MNTRYAWPIVLLLAACGDDAAQPGADLTSAAGDFAGLDLAATDLGKNPSYPAGPYGNTVGATLPPLVWEGYSDPLADAIATSKAYGMYTMNDLRLSGPRYGIVHVSSFS